MAKNYYAVLGIAATASEDQIRRRFRDLARQRHPDRFQGVEKERAENEFQELTEAFNILTDAERRRIHDYEISRPAGAVAADTSDKASRVRAYVARGVKAYKERNFMAAAESFDQATRTDPENAQAWHHLALACSHDRRWEAQAIAAIIKACDLEPMKPSYLKLAGRLHGQVGQIERAEQYYQEALTWGGEDAEVKQALESLRGDRRSRFGFFGKVGG
jgi:curved DNA-binding protein CbpA